MILFAQFDLFRSAVGIGVGVVCLLIIMYTLLPLIMVLLGEKIFWPSKKQHRTKKIDFGVNLEIYLVNTHSLSF